MKIEMGESLFLSWLRHVKQCQIVQLNWKPSNSWELTNEQEIETLVHEGRNYCQQKYGCELFGTKEGQDYTQILSQGEIDVFGIELTGRAIKAIYAVDVAFHEGGLIYGTTDETITRVIKKMLRASFILIGYFGMKVGEIIFASPKVSPKPYKLLNEAIQDINQMMQKQGFQFVFKFYANEEFTTHIINPVVQVSHQVADTSELFMRSIKLYNLADGMPVRNKRTLTLDTSAPGTDEIKIGQLVRTAFNELFENNKISTDLARSLMEPEYSKRTFKLQHPVLKAFDNGKSLAQQTGGRYWSETFGDGKYLVCNDWYDRHRPSFVEWMKQFEE